MGTLWSDDIPGDQALRGPAGRTLSDDPDRTAVVVDARENLLSVSAYGRQRQSHDKCSRNSRYSRHDVSPVAFKRLMDAAKADIGSGRCHQSRFYEYTP